MPARQASETEAAPGPVPAYRKWLVGLGTPAAMAGTLGLHVHHNQYEYGHPFHINRTGMDFMHMDKMLHGYAAYTTARMLDGGLRWAGMAPQKAAWVSAGGSMLFLLAKEYFDGRDARFGWSWGDAGANLVGTGLFALQQLTWHEQRLQLKFSAFPKRYEDPELEATAVHEFGSGFPKRWMKDYNRHTYWLSANLHTIFGSENVPAWINLSVGTGGDNLFGKKENYRLAPDGAVVFDRRDLVQRRQWYLAPDIDLTKIRTGNKLLKTTFFVLNAFKLPMPALELSGGRLRLHPLFW